MGECVALNVRYEGDNDPSQVFQLNPQTQWQDLEAMLKAQYDCENVEVFYIDTDGEYIMMSSQEELQEAFKVAQQCSNTLHLKLRNYTGEPVPTRVDNLPSPIGGDTEVKIMVDPLDHQVPETDEVPEDVCDQQQEMDSTDRELQKIEMWLKDDTCDTKPDIFDKPANFRKEEVQNRPTRLTEEDLVQHDKQEEEIVVKTRGSKHKSKREKSGHDHKRRHCKSAERSRRYRHGDEGETSDDAAMPYDVFIKYMHQLKTELRTEIVRDVTRKTVKQVLKGLDGAVIQSMKGGNTTDMSEQPVSPKKETVKEPVEKIENGTTEIDKASHPVYFHEHVTCDFCERIIVGARYKCCNCADYDLCEECEAIFGVHDPNHVFLKIRRPVRLRNKSPLLKQIIYRSPPTDTDGQIHESAEKLHHMRSKMDKLRAQLSHQKDKMKKKEEKLSKKQRKRDRLYQWLESTTKQINVPKQLVMAAEFLYDVTIPDGTSVQPGTWLMKSWRIRNCGTALWSSYIKLRVVYDCIPAVNKEVTVPPLVPGEQATISVELIAPEKPGRYQSHWKLYDNDNAFGHRIWCDITVEPKQVLEPTREDTLHVVPEQTQLADSVHQKSEYEEIPEQEVRISPTQDFLLEPRHTSLTSKQEPVYTAEETVVEGDNERVIVPDEITELATKMVDDTLKLVEQNQSDDRKEEVLQEREEEVSVEIDGNEPEVEAQEGVNVESEAQEGGERKVDDSIGQSADESDFSDRQGFLHVRGPDLIAFEMMEQEEEKFENAQEYFKEETIVKEKKELSRSSSVEIVTMTNDDITSDEEDIKDHAYMKNLKNPAGGLLEDDDSFSDSSYDIYNDSEDDFLVVPMPACFNLEKPITLKQPGSQSEEDKGDNSDDSHESTRGDNTNVPDKQSVDDILTASGVLEAAPLQPESVATPLNQALPPPVETTPTSQAPPLQEEATPLTETMPLSEEAVLRPEEVNQDDEVAETFEDAFESNSQSDMEETKVIEISPRKPEDKQEEVVTKQPEGATAMENEDDNNEEQRPAELVNQIMHTAVKAANRAAANAYTTAKEVFYTWQARTYQNASGKTAPGNTGYKTPTSSWKPKGNDFKPPQSNWKPKDGHKSEESPWIPPNKTYKPPTSSWRPSEDKWQPPREEGPMGKLGEMGFCNRELNEKLLKKHNNDVEAVVQELLSTTENDWMEQRH